jgi:hypothetical protein
MTALTPTFEQLIDFIMANKTNKVFKNMSLLEIAQEVKTALDENLLYYYTDSNKILGMILADKDEANKIIFVRRNLAMTFDTLKLFAIKASKQFPGYKLRWFKHGIYKRHNTEKFYKKLGITV